MDLISSSANTNFDTLTPEGIRVVVLYAKLHTHLLRPLLEADKPPALVELRRAWPRLERVFGYDVTNACLESQFKLVTRSRGWRTKRTWPRGSP